MGARDNLLLDLATELEVRSAIADMRNTLKRGPVRPNIWGFYSNKNRKFLTLTGDVTFIQAVLLEGNPRVCSYATPSESVPAIDHNYGYKREIVVQLMDGSLEWYLCGRYENLVKDPGTATKKQIEQTRAIATKAGAEFHIKTERDLSRHMLEFRNWLTLCASMTRARDFSSENQTAILYEALDAQKSITFRAAIELPRAEPALMIALIARAISNGQIYCDLSKKPINLEMELTTVGPTRRHLDERPPKTISAMLPEETQPIGKNRRTACIPEAWRDLGRWPKCNPDLTRDDAVYRRNKRAVEMYMANSNFNKIFQETGLREDWVRSLFKKCISCHTDGQIMGFRGVVKYYRKTEYRRTKPLPAENIHEGATGGYAGALAQLFERFPDELLGAIEAHVLKLRNGLVEKIPEAKISWRDLKSEVGTLLKKLGVMENEYPFNTRDQGYSALATIGRSLLFKKPSAFLRARSGKEANRRSGIGKGIPSLIQATGNFQILQLDFHKHDSAATVRLESPTGGTIFAPVPRWWIGCVIDTFNGAILGSSDSFAKQTTESCVMDLIEAAIAPENPDDALRSYAGCKDGCWLPHQLIPSFGFHAWDVLKLDRAWAHQSTNTISNIVATTGCAMCFSRPRSWWARSAIERTFKKLTSRGSQRLPTTYGSGPTDTTRNDPEGQAVSLEVRRDEICMLARSVIREINDTAGEGAFWESAMDSLRRTTSMDTYFPRPLPDARKTDSPTQWVTIVRKVEGSSTEGIAPSVRIQRCRFKGTEIANAWNLIGENVYLQIQRSDIRKARIVNINSGQTICMVYPEHRWLPYRISWQNFLLIQKYGLLKRQHSLPDDPTSDFLRVKNAEVLEKNSKSKKSNLKNAAADFEAVKADFDKREDGEATGSESVSESAGKEDSQNRNGSEGSEPGQICLESLMGSVKKLKSYSRG